MTCSTCGAANPEGARFCDACGAQVTQTCRTCGRPMRPEERFCDECGTQAGREGKRKRSKPARQPRFFRRRRRAILGIAGATVLLICVACWAVDALVSNSPEETRAPFAEELFEAADYTWVVANTGPGRCANGSLGVSLREGPGEGATLQGYCDGTVLKQIGPRFMTDGGESWMLVRGPDGREGWVLDRFLIQQQ